MNDCRVKPTELRIQFVCPMLVATLTNTNRLVTYCIYWYSTRQQNILTGVLCTFLWRAML